MYEIYDSRTSSMCEARPCSSIFPEPMCSKLLTPTSFRSRIGQRTTRSICQCCFSPHYVAAPSSLPPLLNSNHTQYWTACRARHLKHHMAQEMVQTEGLQSSLFAYNALISGCASGRGYDRAIGYFNEMVSRPAILRVRNEGRPFVVLSRNGTFQQTVLAVRRGTFGRACLFGEICR